MRFDVEASTNATTASTPRKTPRLHRHCATLFFTLVYVHREPELRRALGQNDHPLRGETDLPPAVASGKVALPPCARMGSESYQSLRKQK
jgi:hypothetical protein